MYWTDGNTINMASMDGSNSKVLHQNQRDPVGQSESFGWHAVKLYLIFDSIQFTFICIAPNHSSGSLKMLHVVKILQ